MHKVTNPRYTEHVDGYGDNYVKVTFDCTASCGMKDDETMAGTREEALRRAKVIIDGHRAHPQAIFYPKFLGGGK